MFIYSGSFSALVGGEDMFSVNCPSRLECKLHCGGRLALVQSPPWFGKRVSWALGKANHGNPNWCAYRLQSWSYLLLFLLHSLLKLLISSFMSIKMQLFQLKSYLLYEVFSRVIARNWSSPSLNFHCFAFVSYREYIFCPVLCIFACLQETLTS